MYAQKIIRSAGAIWITCILLQLGAFVNTREKGVISCRVHTAACAASSDNEAGGHAKPEESVHRRLHFAGTQPASTHTNNCTI
jgi:hypothetical protein